jgi:hypothetical protein
VGQYVFVEAVDACEVCVAAGEELKRRGLRAILGAFDG